MTTLTDEHQQHLTITDFRAALVFLDWQIFTTNYPDMRKNDLIDWAGLVPDFFYHAMLATGNSIDVHEVAGAMDDVYGFNALGHPFKDSRIVPSNSGPVIRHPEDDDLKPIVGLTYEGRHIKCLVYPYGMVGLINRKGDQLVFRMD